MKFDLENLNPGTWFFFDEEDESQGRICLRIMDADTLTAIRKKTVKEVPEYKRNKRFTSTKVNEKLSSELTWDHCIIDWEGVLDQHGNEVECNTANRVLLMGKSPVFATFVADCLERLNDLDGEHQEELEKN